MKIGGLIVLNNTQDLEGGAFNKINLLGASAGRSFSSVVTKPDADQG